MDNLTLTDICHHYGEQGIVHQFNMTLKPGEVGCLLGPSGCGKSTILRLIAGLEKPTSGKIMIHEHTVSDGNHFIPPEKRKVGLVFQDASLFPHLTVKENVAFGLHRMNQEVKDSIVTERLMAVGMFDYEDHYPHMLSGGQQQRVAIARALAFNPDVMLLDEPFANLDVVLRKHIREETMALLKSLDVATLLVTHDPDEALRMADHIYVLEKGKVVQEGIGNDFYHQPQTPFVASFFGELNCLEGEVKKKKVETELGTFAAGNLTNDQQAQVLIRPEGIDFSTAKSSTKKAVKAIVENVRFLGTHSILYISLQDSAIPLRVKTSKAKLPVVGAEISLQVDPKHVFVFDLNATKETCHVCGFE